MVIRVMYVSSVFIRFPSMILFTVYINYLLTICQTNELVSFLQLLSESLVKNWKRQTGNDHFKDHVSGLSGEQMKNDR